MYVAISASIIVRMTYVYDEKCHQMKKLCERHITTKYIAMHTYTVGCKKINVCNCDYAVGL